MSINSCHFLIISPPQDLLIRVLYGSSILPGMTKSNIFSKIIKCLFQTDLKSRISTCTGSQTPQLNGELFYVEQHLFRIQPIKGRNCVLIPHVRGIVNKFTDCAYWTPLLQNGFHSNVQFLTEWFRGSKLQINFEMASADYDMTAMNVIIHNGLRTVWCNITLGNAVSLIL